MRNSYFNMSVTLNLATMSAAVEQWGSRTVSIVSISLHDKNYRYVNFVRKTAAVALVLLQEIYHKVQIKFLPAILKSSGRHTFLDESDIIKY